MLESMHDIVLEVLECLGGCARDEILPYDALDRVGALRSRYPDQGIELLWERQGFDQSVHYDALIRGCEPLSVSISVCPDRALPWPLRGAQRTRDGDLIRVNSVVLTVADAIARLDVLWQSERLMQAMVDGCLIEDALRSSAISVDGQEIQQALDSIRRRRGLYSAAQMRAWMQASGTSEQSLEHMAVEVARARKLRDHLVGGRAEIMLRERLCDFDLISFAQLPMPSAEAAHRALDNMRSGSANFHELAELECARGGHTASLYFRRLRRLRLELPLARALEGARPGVSVGPVELGSGVNLVKLVAVEPAQLGPQTLEAAKAKLFEEWLDERRGRAKVEWFWGNTERTSTRACVHGDLSPWADGT